MDVYELMILFVIVLVSALVGFLGGIAAMVI